LCRLILKTVGDVRSFLLSAFQPEPLARRLAVLSASSQGQRNHSHQLRLPWQVSQPILALVSREETIFILEKKLHLKEQLPVGAFLVDGFQPCGNGSAG
jgi:hypothetical protein